jgi:D-amino-acid dehydrogenase
MRVIVLGAGLAGTTTAYFLAHAGCDVEVVEGGATAAPEASYGTAGLIHVSLAEPWNSPETIVTLARSFARRNGAVRLRPRELLRILPWGLRFLAYSRGSVHRAHTALNSTLALYSQATYAELRDTLGLDYDHRRRGLLKIFRDQSRLDAVAGTSRHLTALGIPFEVLTRDALLEREPLLAAGLQRLAGGIYYPDDESGCPAKFTRALALRAEGLGARFRFGELAVAIERDGGLFSAVVTDRERLTADACVIAAGAASEQLARQVGLRLPLAPVKGYLTTFPITAEMPLPRAPLVDDGRRIAVNVLGNRLRISGSAEFAGLDYSVDRVQVDQVVQRACATLPGLADHLRGAAGEPWACLRPMSADGVPMLGATAVPNLFVNTGAGHLGWTLAAGAGRLVTAAVLGKVPAIPLDGFALDRFRWRR